MDALVDARIGAPGVHFLEVKDGSLHGGKDLEQEQQVVRATNVERRPRTKVKGKNQWILNRSQVPVKKSVKPSYVVWEKQCPASWSRLG